MARLCHPRIELSLPNRSRVRVSQKARPRVLVVVVVVVVTRRGRICMEMRNLMAPGSLGTGASGTRESSGSADGSPILRKNKPSRKTGKRKFLHFRRFTLSSRDCERSVMIELEESPPCATSGHVAASRRNSLFIPLPAGLPKRA